MLPFLNHPFKQTTNLLPRTIFSDDTWRERTTHSHILTHSLQVFPYLVTLLFATGKSSMLQAHLLNLLLTYLLQMAALGPVGPCSSQSCCQDVLFPIHFCLSLKYFLCSCMACSSKGTFIPSTQVNIRAFTTGPSPGNINRKLL